MPAKNKRSKGQKRRQAREANLPPAERDRLLNEYSQTRGAIAARAARPREELWEQKCRKRRVQAWRRLCSHLCAPGSRCLQHD